MLRPEPVTHDGFHRFADWQSVIEIGDTEPTALQDLTAIGEVACLIYHDGRGIHAPHPQTAAGEPDRGSALTAGKVKRFTCYRELVGTVGEYRW